MALIRWDPVRELDSLQGDMNRLFDRFFDGGQPNGGERNRRWIPAMDVVEKDDHLELRADLPGMNEDDVNIEVKDGVLTISGERKAEEEETREGYRRVERVFGRFSRSVALPDGIDPNDVHASFEDGVLVVRIPKPKDTEPTRVAIGAGAGNGTEKQKQEAGGRQKQEAGSQK